MKLPTPACKYGYTEDQIKEIMGSRLAEFNKWMNGQTCTICEGREYSHELEKYIPGQCFGNPHGVVVYTWDVEQFLKGGNALN